MTTETRIEKLECNCCGSYAPGRQWWNRDTGYGLCLRCGTEQEAEYGEAVVKDWAGVKGFNWGVNEEAKPNS